MSAIELDKGERLLAADGLLPRLVAFACHAEQESVYNIESDDYYRVGEQGVLVHNMSQVTPCCITSVELVPPANQPSGVIFQPTGYPFSFSDVGTWENKSGDGHYQNIHWVVWRGTNLDESLWRRDIRLTLTTPDQGFAQRTAQLRGVTATQASNGMWTVDVGGGFVQGDRTTSGRYWDGPHTGIFMSSDDRLRVVADAVGLLDAHEASKFPVTYEVNFYHWGKSRADQMIKGEIWYEVRIRFFAPASAGTNTLTLLAKHP